MKHVKKLIPQLIKSPLRRFLYKNSLTTSQAGQDFWVYGEMFNENRNGYFLDIGAHDGIQLSNTYLLESKYKWKGICIEANPITFAELMKNRRALCLNLCLDRSEGEVNFVLRGTEGGIVDHDLDNKELEKLTYEIVKLKTTPLVSVLEKYNAPRIIDYLSIDVEGAEERVLAEFDFHKYIFRCITIERPTKLLRDLFKKHDYILVKEIPDLDCFYIHKSYLAKYNSNLYLFYSKMYLKIRWR